MSEPRWRDATECAHINDDVCATCDFDSYYALSFESCPWRSDRLAELTSAVLVPAKDET